MYEKYLLQLEEAGKIRNLKERSIICYKNYVSYFLNYMEKHPEELTCQDVRDFLLAKKDDGLKATTLNLYNSAIRFFYRNVLHVLWDDITVPRMIIEHKLPTVLSTDEIDRLLDATDDLKYKAMFATMYSSGMRVSEVIHLHYDDISRTNMQIHVRDTKNRMDRYTILSERNLALLTDDFNDFYQMLPHPTLAEHWQLEKIFSNYRCHTYDICLLALFLGVPVTELVDMKLPEKTQAQLFDEEIIWLHNNGLNYRQISQKMGASYDYCKLAAKRFRNTAK